MLGPIGSDNILLNLNRNQQNLGNLTSQLASGLRIQTAADDPSGLAISENFRAHIAGLQQSVENVQTGGNLLTVADGTAATIQAILQRISSLIVESNSDINSNEQLSAIQTEIDSLLQEINHESSTANFNGLKLFDGSHDTYVAAPNPAARIVEINPGLNPDGTAPTGDSVTNPQNPAAPPGFESDGKIIQNLTEQGSQQIIPGLFILQISGFSNNPSDPVLGPLGQPGVYLNQILYSTSQSFANGQGNESIFVNATPTNQGYDNGISGPGSRGGSEQFPSTPTNGVSLAFDFPNFSAGDVGASIGFEIFQPKQSGGGTAININDGGQEGSTVAISLPTLSTNALQISDISVLRPTQVDDQLAQGTPTGVDSSNQYAAMDAQIRVDDALDQISQLRATIGAQMVSTQEDANNDNTAIVNFQATESSIRDLNIGTATTEFTREQILNSVGTSVLAQSEVSARQLTALLISALVA